MVFKLENIGIVRYAEVEMGKLNIICGMNNSGKTYITYAIYGFLYFWKNMFKLPIELKEFEKLKESGVYNLPLLQYIDKAPQIIKQACIEYTEMLSSVFSSHERKFVDASLMLDVSPGEILLADSEYEGGIRSPDTKTGLKFRKEENSDVLIITLFSKDDDYNEIPDFIVGQTISDAIKKIVFSSVFPSTFIISAERTGAAIFRKELNFARNKIIEAVSKNDVEIDPLFLLRETVSDYAWPVEHNVEFTRNLENIFKSESYIFKHHREIIESFTDVLGGTYQVTEEDGLFFKPESKNKKAQLSMDESSGSARSLLDIGFYLKHKAQVGDILMIDEPELNLHPANQRKLARLLARLVNCGIMVFVTTHSDYILRELNNLILLKGNKPHFSQIVENEGYSETELLSASCVKIFTAREENVIVPGNKRRSKVNTLVRVSVDDEVGIENSSFDDVINDMNRISDDIMFGG